MASILKSQTHNPHIPRIWTPKHSLLLISISLLSLITRFSSLTTPPEVVFDEVHLGTHINNYLHNSYFIDVSPPLGKLIYVWISKLLGYHGTTSFEYIGQDFTGFIDYLGLRMVSAFVGSLIPILMFFLLITLDLSLPSILLGSIFILFDNALICESRFILLGSFLTFFSLSTSLFHVQYLKSKSWIYLLLSGCFLGLSISTQISGILSWIHILFWTFFIESTHSRKEKFWTNIIHLFIVPISIYIGVHHVHLSTLYKTGPGAVFMGVDFQKSLHDRILRTSIDFGSHVSIFNPSDNIFLHSHHHPYPLVHLDGKVSSQGQQVTGYPGRDSNNTWILERSHAIRRTTQSIQDQDIVRVRHLNTGEYLCCHDVASPLTRTNMEVTAVSESERYDDTLWRIEFLDKDRDSVLDTWTLFRLVHESTKACLKNHNQNLPAWGFHQREINGDKDCFAPSTVWRIVNEERGEETPVEMGFLWKLYEHQKVFFSMLVQDTSSTPHPYASSPSMWPLMVKGISMWDDVDTHSQIYFLGNPIVWTICFFGVMLGVVFCPWAYRRFETELKNRDQYWSMFFFTTWLFRYIPFFACPLKNLFLTSYMPAFIASVPLTCVFLERVLSHRGYGAQVLAGMAVMIVWTFGYFSPLTFGWPMTTEQGRARQWMPTWEYLVTLYPNTQAPGSG